MSTVDNVVVVHDVCSCMSTVDDVLVVHVVCNCMSTVDNVVVVHDVCNCNVVKVPQCIDVINVFYFFLFGSRFLFFPRFFNLKKCCQMLSMNMQKSCKNTL